MTSDDDVKEISPAPSDLTAGMMSEVRGGGAGARGRGWGEAAGWFSRRTKETKSCKIKLSFKFISNKCLFFNISIVDINTQELRQSPQH